MVNKTFNPKIVILFYVVILLTTYLSRQLPNGLQFLLFKITGLNLPFNYNHGIAVLLTSFLFYKFSTIKQRISLLGNKDYLSLIFPAILFIGYSILGFENNYGVNKHLWAFVFCVATLIYDLMEEYAWRGYLIESLSSVRFWIKAVLSGVLWACWHFLIFENFNQFGGFTYFLIFSIIFSIILTYSTIKTKSIIVPATLHATLSRTNYVTLALFGIYFLVLILWDKIKISKYNESR